MEKEPGSIQFNDCKTIFEATYTTSQGIMKGLSAYIHEGTGIVITQTGDCHGKLNVLRHPDLAHAINHYTARAEWNAAMARQLHEYYEEQPQISDSTAVH